MILAAPETFQRSQQLRVRERSIISTQTLLEDNHSGIAQQNIKEWQKSKETQGGLTLFIVCSDARIVSAKIFGAKNIASIASISGKTDLNAFKDLLLHESIGQIVVVGHFDYQTLEEGKSPSGCGGEKVSQKIRKGEVVKHRGLHQFISDQISPNFFENILKTVKQAVEISGKPVLGIALDHLTNAAFPIIEVGPNTIEPYLANTSNFNWKKITDELFDRFIALGTDLFPELSKIEDLYEPFKEFILRNRVHVEAETRKYKKDPALKEKYKTQNPSTVVISTSPIPLALRFPNNFGEQNEAFVIRQSFVKKDTRLKVDDDNDFVDGPITIKNINFKLMAAQLYYPISHAITAAVGQDFHDTTNILIETPSLELSAKIADRLSKEEFVQQWINERKGKIMISQVTSGNVDEIREFNPNESK